MNVIKFDSHWHFQIGAFTWKFWISSISSKRLTTHWFHPARVLGGCPGGWGILCHLNDFQLSAAGLPHWCAWLPFAFLFTSLETDKQWNCVEKKKIETWFISINNLFKYLPRPFTAIVNLDPSSFRHLQGARPYLLHTRPNNISIWWGLLSTANLQPLHSPQ